LARIQYFKLAYCLRVAALGAVLQAIADYECQPAATWQPFVVMVDLLAAAPPVVTAVSNYTWCATRRTQLVASTIVGDGAKLQLNTKLYKVDSSGQALLMLLNAQRTTNPGGQLTLFDKSSKHPKADASCGCCGYNACPGAGSVAAAAASIMPAHEHHHMKNNINGVDH
jgi:hypothetical protein